MTPIPDALSRDMLARGIINRNRPIMAAKVIHLLTRDERVAAAARARTLASRMVDFITDQHRPVTPDEILDFVMAEFRAGTGTFTHSGEPDTS